MLQRFKSLLDVARRRRSINGRELQEAIDMATVNLLVNDLSVEEVSENSDAETKSQVARALQSQVSKLFRALDQGHIDSIKIGASKRYFEDPLESSFEVRMPSVDAVQERLKLASDCVKANCGFFTQVKESSIPSAGNGVFISGDVPAGTVVALYPGHSYLPFQIQSLHDAAFRNNGSGKLSEADKTIRKIYGTNECRNVYVLQRIDGVTINSIDGSTSSKPNYFACGHMINHPPQGTLPNVLQCRFDFTKDFIQEETRQGQSKFKAYIPNSLAKEDGVTPGWWWYIADRNLYAPSVVYVTSRDIKDGEELFVNYRFNPKHQVPPWYHPVDAEEDRRRWSID